MKKLKPILFLIPLFIVFFGCKKEVKVIKNPNTLGTILGNGYNQTITEVIQTAEDEFYICGSVSRDELGLSDGYLMKLDKDFNLLWQKNFGGKQNDYFRGMAMDENGNILLAGISNSYNASIDSTVYKVNPLVFLAYVDKDGNTIWQKTHQPKHGKDSINKDNDVTKVLYLKDKSFSISCVTTNFTNQGGAKMEAGYVFSVNESGTLIWDKLFYSTDPKVDYSYIMDIAQSQDGDIFILTNYIINNPYTTYANIFKVSNKPAALTSNTYISKIQLTNEYFETMINLDGDNMYIMSVMGNMYHVNTNGQIKKMKEFEKNVELFDVNSKGINEQLLITGTYFKDIRYYPFWAVRDANGDFTSEIYLDFNQELGSKIYPNSIFINKKNEVIMIGTIKQGDNSNILILRFDNKGNLLR